MISTLLSPSSSVGFISPTVSLVIPVIAKYRVGPLLFTSISASISQTSMSFFQDMYSSSSLNTGGVFNWFITIFNLFNRTKLNGTQHSVISTTPDTPKIYFYTCNNTSKFMSLKVLSWWNRQPRCTNKWTNSANL